MNAAPANMVAIGPWCVEMRLPALGEPLRDRPYLSLEGGRGEWVAEKWKRWEGSEVDARELAETYGAVAVPRCWVPASEARREAVPLGGSHVPRVRQHLRDRTGEEIES